jgi:Lysozyme like domain
MAVTLPGRKSSYTGSELARIVVWTGFRGTPAARAVAIILAESGGRTGARNWNGPTRGCPNGSLDRGLAQINSCYHSEVSDTCAFDPYCNVAAMWRISSHGTSFSPWATFNSGAYRQFINAAAEWVSQVQQAGGVGPAIPTPVVSQASPSTLDQALDWVLGPLNWGPIGWLKDHIKSVVLAGGRYVYDHLRPLIHDVGVAAHEGLHLIGVLRGWAHKGFVDVRNWTHAGFVAIKAWTTIGLRNLERWARRLAYDVRVWVKQDIWAPLKRAWDSTVKWVKTSVIPFLQRAINAVEHALGKARDFLLGLIRAAEKWAKDAVAFLIRLVADAVNWVRKFGAKVWWIVDHCWDFLFYVATHPLSWFRGLVDDVIGRGGNWFVGKVLSAMLKESGKVEDLIVRWFGG